MAEKQVVYSENNAPPFPAVFDVPRKSMLNMTDINSNNNKWYLAELHLAGDQIRIHTQYGRVGKVQAKEYRVCSTRAEADKLFDKIIKDKTKKGYVEVKLVKSDVGSEIGKAKIEQDSIKIEAAEKLGIKVEEGNKPSKLHIEVQKLVEAWFGSTSQFVQSNLDTKKCPLGQLSLDQLAKGKEILDQARVIVHATKGIGPSHSDYIELNRLTSLSIVTENPAL